MAIKCLVVLAFLGASHGVIAETYVTSRCAQFGHPEFEFRVTNEAIPPQDVQWLRSYLEEAVASGERFKPEENLQIGWMVTKLAPGPSGHLVITEPDMKTIPIEFVDSVDNTLRHLRSQKDSVESAGPDVALAFPSLIGQSAVVHKNYQSAREVLLDRAESDGADSGWWLSDLADRAGNQDAANFTRVSLYQLAIDRPDLVKFLAFPSGYKIALTLDGIIVFAGDDEAPLREGSFLSELNRRNAPNGR